MASAVEAPPDYCREVSAGVIARKVRECGCVHERHRLAPSVAGPYILVTGSRSRAAVRIRGCKI